MFKNLLQLICGITNSKIMPNGTKMIINIPYVVETSCFPRSKSLSATASARRFFKPKEKPTSKKLSHNTTDDIVSHIP